MSKTETTNVKRNIMSGDPKEILQFATQVENEYSRLTMENRIDKDNRETIRLESLMTLAKNCYLPDQRDCCQTAP